MDRRRRRRRSLALFAAAPLLASALLGCGRSGDVASSPLRPTPRPGVGGLRWTAPVRWVESAPSGMRAASYEVPGAPGQRSAGCSVFYFGPGRAGTITANLDRWRSQFSSVAHDDLATRETGGLELTVVEIAGTYAPTSAARDRIADALLLGAAIAGPQGPVFVKCVGPREALAPARNELAALLGSIASE